VLPNAGGYFECVFDAGSRPSLTATTTYYIGLHYASGQNPMPIMEGNATYAGGQEFWENNVMDWNYTGNGQAQDMNFKTRMCD
jgi:hypothetical protein